MRVLIVRHPPVSIPEGLCYGRRDVPLAPGWEIWADALLELASALPQPVSLLHSPLTRCRAPARRLVEHARDGVRLSARPASGLLELDFGAWDGLTWDAVPRAELDDWAADVATATPWGGESVTQMYRRSRDVLEGVRRDGECASALLLTHSGPVRCLLAHVLGLGPAAVLRLRVDLGAVSAVTLSDDGDRLDYSNRASPLTPFPGGA